MSYVSVWFECHICSAMFYVSARFEWKPDDPEIVSDVLFAVANVMSIARTTYLMPAFEVLGPLQISLGRMIGDITRFLVLFTLVGVSFCSTVGPVFHGHCISCLSRPVSDGQFSFEITT